MFLSEKTIDQSPFGILHLFKHLTFGKIQSSCFHWTNGMTNLEYFLILLTSIKMYLFYF